MTTTQRIVTGAVASLLLLLSACGGGNDGVTQFCGDGIVNGQEECDNGAGVGSGCTEQCLFAADPFEATRRD